MTRRLLLSLALGLLASLAPAMAQTDASALPPAPAAPPARVEGRIIAARVHGTVTARNLQTGDTRVLASGDTLAEHYEVATGAGASVVLVFSNGATVDLAADSSLDIAQFVQDPFAQTVNVATLGREPSATSLTQLNLVRGELVSKVVHLNTDRGSEFTVNTPVGAAGIRGTIFRIVFRPTAGGKANFSVTTLEGEIILRGLTFGPVSVPAGKQVVFVNITIPPPAAPGSPESSGAPSTTVTIVATTTPPAEAEEIETAVQSIAAALSTVTFTPSPSGSTNATTPPTTNTQATTPSTDSTTAQPVNPTTVSPSG